MFKVSLAQKALLTNMPKRAFSSLKQAPKPSGSQWAAFGMGSVGVAGLTYISYQGRMARANATPMQQMHLNHPIVQERLGKTMAYFTGACGMTGAMTYAMRNSQRALMMNPWLLLALSIGSLIGTQMIDYNRNFVLKNLMYGAFVGTMSASLLPLIHMYSMPVIYDALIASSAVTGSLGLVAYNSPSQQFLNWGGPLSLGLGGLLGVSLLQILYPHSRALYSISLYGGLGLFSLFMMYHTGKMMDNAKTKGAYDPINNSLGVYIAAVNIFQSMVMILGGSRKK